MVYDFKKVRTGERITSSWILSRITDSQIFFHYHGRFKLNTVTKSMFRLDQHPSATFFVGESGEIVYYDFRDGIAMNCFDYVKRLFNVNFDRALSLIAEDFGLVDRRTSKVSPRTLSEAADLDRATRHETLIQFTIKPWESGIGSPLSFWNLYEVSKDDLETDGIYCVDRLFLNKKEIHNPEGFPRFAKCELFGEKMGVKIYSPTDKSMKWLSSIPLDVPFGLNSLSTVNTSNTVMITKSFKDRLILLKIFDNVIATQNESEGALPQSVIEKLDQMYDKKIIVFDNDEVGVTNSKKFNEKGFGYFNIPVRDRERFGIKDPADYVKTYGLDQLRELFIEKNLL